MFRMQNDAVHLPDRIARSTLVRARVYIYGFRFSGKAVAPALPIPNGSFHTD